MTGTDKPVGNIYTPVTSLKHIRRLPSRVEPLPFESFDGYLCRVAQIYSYNKPGWFMALASDGPTWDFNTYLRKIACLPNGGPTWEFNKYLRKLAYILRLEISELQKMIYYINWNKEEAGKILFLGHPARDTHLNIFRPRVCTLCLEETSIHWAVWELRLVTACPFHRCHLINRCPSCERFLTRNHSVMHKCRCGKDFRGIASVKADNLLVMINAAIYRAVGFYRFVTGAELNHGEISPVLYHMKVEKMLDFIRSFGMTYPGRVPFPEPLNDLNVAMHIGLWTGQRLMNNSPQSVYEWFRSRLRIRNIKFDETRYFIKYDGL